MLSLEHHLRGNAHVLEMQEKVSPRWTGRFYVLPLAVCVPNGPVTVVVV